MPRRSRPLRPRWNGEGAGRVGRNSGETSHASDWFRFDQAVRDEIQPDGDRQPRPLVHGRISRALPMERTVHRGLLQRAPDNAAQSGSAYTFTHLRPGQVVLSNAVEVPVVRSRYTFLTAVLLLAAR
jgi:hypothetical protein